MRSSEGESRWWFSATVGVIIVNLLVYALQHINLAYFGLPLEQTLALHPKEVARGYVWQLLTYSFLHSGNWHFLLNNLFLFLFGRFVEEVLGRTRFFEVYFLSAFAGGLLDTVLAWLVPQYFGGIVMGASAAVLGLVAVFALLEPDRIILLWFVLPVRAKYFLWVAAGTAIFFVIVPTDPSVAHAAHLGGLLGGTLYTYGFVRTERNLWNWRREPAVAEPQELVNAPAHRRSPWRRAAADTEEELSPDEFISREVDPILDKISAHGLQSLTQRERQILETARKKIAKR